MTIHLGVPAPQYPAPATLAEVVCSECGPEIKQWPCCEAQWRQSCVEMRFIQIDHSAAARQKRHDVKLRLKQSLFSAVSQANYDRLLKLFSWTAVPISTRGEVRVRPLRAPAAVPWPHWQLFKSNPAQRANFRLPRCSQAGNTVLHTAVSTGSEQGVSLLLAIGADVYARNDGVRAARRQRIHTPAPACSPGSFWFAARPYAQGDIPLHDAAFEGRLPIARMLVLFGADPCMTDEPSEVGLPPWYHPNPNPHPDSNRMLTPPHKP
jgi:hypothetical protein